MSGVAVGPGAPRAVVLRAIGLGDFVTGLPALALLRRARPDLHVTAAVPARFAPVLATTGLVDAIAPVDDLGPLPPSLAGPDVAIDLHGNGPASRGPLAALHPGRLVAFGAGVTWDPDEHEVERWCRLLREGLGVQGANPTQAGLVPVAALPDRLPVGAVVVHPGAASPSRRWPVPRFAEVVAAMVGRGHDVVVTGTPGEGDLVDAVVAAGHAVAVRTGRGSAVAATDLGVTELFAVVAHARLVITGDTGTAHVASAYARPSVVLFGPVAPSRWGPPPLPQHQALHLPRPGDPPGDPHGREVDPVLLRLTVDDVLAAVQRALAVPDAVPAAGRVRSLAAR